MPETKRRVRPRSGYVMVELTPELRAEFEACRDRLQAQIGVTLSLAEVVRHWIRMDAAAAKKKAKNPPHSS